MTWATLIKHNVTKKSRPIKNSILQRHFLVENGESRNQRKAENEEDRILAAP